MSIVDHALNTYRSYSNNKFIGFIVVHGFTSTVQSILYVAQQLRSHEYTVVAPLLPGHGEEWTSLNDIRVSQWQQIIIKEIEDLKKRGIKNIFIIGQSMGGTLALDTSINNAYIKGVVIINAPVTLPNPFMCFACLLKSMRFNSVGGDIARLGVDEVHYKYISGHVVNELKKLILNVKKNLCNIKKPIINFISHVDHIVTLRSHKYFINNIGSDKVQIIKLLNSNHVATLDYDADFIIKEIINNVHCIINNQFDNFNIKNVDLSFFNSATFIIDSQNNTLSINNKVDYKINILKSLVSYFNYSFIKHISPEIELIINDTIHLLEKKFQFLREINIATEYYIKEIVRFYNIDNEHNKEYLYAISGYKLVKFRRIVEEIIYRLKLSNNVRNSINKILFDLYTQLKNNNINEIKLYIYKLNDIFDDFI